MARERKKTANLSRKIDCSVVFTLPQRNDNASPAQRVCSTIEYAGQHIPALRLPTNAAILSGFLGLIKVLRKHAVSDKCWSVYGCHGLSASIYISRFHLYPHLHQHLPSAPRNQQCYGYPRTPRTLLASGSSPARGRACGFASYFFP